MDMFHLIIFPFQLGLTGRLVDSQVSSQSYP